MYLTDLADSELIGEARVRVGHGEQVDDAHFDAVLELRTVDENRRDPLEGLRPDEVVNVLRGSREAIEPHRQSADQHVRDL